MPKDFDFESSLSKLEGEEKAMFTRFVKKMVTWDPEDRASAKDLLKDPWLSMEPRQP